MLNVQQMYKDTKSVNNFSPAFKIQADILQTLMNQLNSNGKQNFDLKTPMYSMPPANLTNSYDPVTFNGAMATAQGAGGITQVGSIDNIVVANGGTNTDSWFRLNQWMTVTPFIARMKIKVKALGAAPVLGFKTLGVGAPYSNFTNQLRTLTCDLLTGAITANSSSNTAVTSKNQFSNAVQVDEVLDVWFEIYNQNYLKLRVERINSTGEISEYTQTVTSLGVGMEWQTLAYIGAIMFDGTYQLLSYDYYQPNTQNAVIDLLGDSLLTGARILYTDTIQYFLQSQLPTRIGNYAAGTMYLAGMQFQLKQLIRTKPQSVILCNVLDACFQGYANPANPNYATWSAAFSSLVDTLINAGIQPILFVPSDVVLYNATALAYLKTYWTTNYPTRQYVEIFPNEVHFDGTTFHYNGVTNAIAAAKIIEVLQTLNLV